MKQRVGSAASALRHSYTLSSWFMLPDQGMTSFEVLSRASAFLTPWRSRPEPRGGASAALRLPKYHVIGSAHVTHPFFFPNYYPEHQYPWLQYVSEEDTLNKLELRSESGEVLHEFLLARHNYRHDKQDLIVLHLHDEAEFETVLEQAGSPVAPLTMHGDGALVAGDRVVFAGNLVQNCGKEGEEVQIPHSAEGTVHVATSTKMFVRTEKQLPMGMCGGPVIDSRGYCVGMTEGVVNAPRDVDGQAPSSDEFTMLSALTGNAACITSSELARFVDEVEHVHALYDPHPLHRRR